MVLYDAGRAPNPRRVRIFLAEKGLDVEKRQVDLGALAHKAGEFTAINPLQRVPALVLDDGTIITESIAICRYFDTLAPKPELFGSPGREAAIVEMWNRRLELHLLFPVSQVFRHLHPGMQTLEVPQVAAWGEANKPRVFEFLEVFDAHLAANRFAAGDAFTVADITGLVAVDLMKPAKLAVPDAMRNVRRWHDEVNARPSASA
jgi:glutathione S-transferase